MDRHSACSRIGQPRCAVSRGFCSLLQFIQLQSAAVYLARIVLAVAACLLPCNVSKALSTSQQSTTELPPLQITSAMGPDFREVATHITSALNLGEDEGKIEALTASLTDAANKSFGRNSELKAKLVLSLNQSSLSQSTRVRDFLDGDRGGGTIIMGELSPLQRKALAQTMSPEQIESLGLARNILKSMMDDGAGQQPEPEGQDMETPTKGVQFSFSGAVESPLGKMAAEMKDDEATAMGVDISLNQTIIDDLCPSIVEISQTFLGSVWETCLSDLVKSAMSSANETNSTTADNTRLLAKTKNTFTKYMENIDKVLQERAGQQETLDTAIDTRRSLHLTMTETNTKIAVIMKLKLRKGMSESGVERSTWGNMTEAQIAAISAQLEGLREEKTGLNTDINDYKASITDLNDVVDSYVSSIQTIVSQQLAESDVGTANPKEKTMSEISIDKFRGELTKEAMLSADKPETGVLLEQMLKNILVCYPVQTSLVGAAILRVLDEKQTGKHKVPPMNIAAEKKCKGTLAKEHGVSQTLIDEYCNQSGAVYSVFMRFSDLAMRKANRPVKVHGSAEKSALVHAVDGDIATAIFMILDDTEKYGWNDRNSKREYFAHCEPLIAQENSLIRVIELLRLPIPESIRIGVVIEYDTLKKAATMFMRRAGVLLTDICNRYITRTTVGEDTNYIITFEEMLAEIHQKLTDCSIDETTVITASAHQVHDYETFCVYANTVIGDQWRGGAAAPRGDDDGGRKTKRAEQLTEMPTEYANMKCGAKGCDKPVDFNTAKSIISYMKSKNIPMGERDVLCKGCNKKLKDPTIQCSEVMTKSGRILTTKPGQGGGIRIVTKRDDANHVEGDEEHQQQPDDTGDAPKTSTKLSAAEILKLADNLTHTEYMEYKRMQSEKFDNEQY